ncbi:MAG: autotransporter outer membrane beta-barrel domain-containing protein [Methylobacteriaceae bacterium]|nr:autotransporter outer membrane beta-barrel domain-containing protein [Methylobacteriaceae bacterium]
MTGDTVGGFATSGNAVNNEVTISGSMQFGVFGGVVNYGSDGDVTGNRVSITDSTVTDWVWGGYASGAGNVNSNTVVLDNSTINGVVYGGQNFGSGRVDDNEVVIRNESVIGAGVYGGEGSSVSGNSVSVSGGSSVYGDVYGGVGTGDGGASGNTVSISGNSLTTSGAFGGWDMGSGGGASGNRVTVSDSSVNTSWNSSPGIAGGYSDQGSADNNTVVLTNAIVMGAVYGGYSVYSAAGSASGNSLSITGGDVAGGDIIGGGSGLEGDANNNTVTVTDVQTDYIFRIVGGTGGGETSGNRVTVSGLQHAGEISGGYGAVADNNTVIIDGSAVTDGTIVEYVVGGGAWSGSASGNRVSITAAQLWSTAKGGWSGPDGDANGNIIVLDSVAAEGAIHGGYSGGAGRADGNEVVIRNNSVISSSYSGYVYGGQGNGASGNTVTISGNSAVAVTVFGGHDTGGGGASGNTVTISDSSVNMDFLGWPGVAGGYSEMAESNNNTVTLTDASVNGFVYGGYAGNGSASGNSVSITGGDGNPVSVFGGISLAWGGNADNNTVTITGLQTDSLDEILGGGAWNEETGAFGNRVTVSGGGIGSVRQIIGGEGSTAGNNTVNLSGPIVVEAAVMGGSGWMGSVSGNSVTIDGAVVMRWVAGGWADTGDASGNRVELSNTTVNEPGTEQVYVITGGITREGNASGNTVILRDVTVVGTYSYSDWGATVSGGFTRDSGDASDNVVVMTGGSIEGDFGWVVGGYTQREGNTNNNTLIVSGVTDNTAMAVEYVGGLTESGNAYGNTVTVFDSDAISSIAGGVNRNGTGGGAWYNTVRVDNVGQASSIAGGDGEDAGYNTVVVTNSTVGSVRGGWSSEGASTNNSVLLIDTGVTSQAWGGWSSHGDATDNTLTVINAPKTDDLGRYYGGEAGDRGVATGNRVFLTDSFAYEVIGGYAYELGSHVSGNSAFVSGGYVEYCVFGGYASGGYASNNSAVLSQATVHRDVYGGQARFTADTNSVVVVDSTVDNNVFGGYSGRENALNNSVVMSGGSVGNSVYGGYAGGGSASGNSVTLADVAVAETVYGGYAGTGDASGNTVSLTGGSVGSHTVYGGYAVAGAASGNSVAIDGTDVAGDIYGGYAEDGDAAGNTVTLFGATAASASVFGGYSGSGGDALSGNTLNVRTASTVSVAGNVTNFSAMNFSVPAGFFSADAPLLSVAGEADVDNVVIGLTDEAGTAYAEGAAIGALTARPMAGQKNALMTAGSLNGAIANPGGIYQATYGVSDYDFRLQQETNSVVLTYTGASHLNQNLAGTYTYQPSARTIAVNTGFDHVLDVVDDWKYASKGHFAPNSGVSAEGWSTVASVKGGAYRTRTGSHVDSNGLSYMAGVAHNWTTSGGDLLVGAFIEGGSGSYDAYHAFGSASGDTRHYGAGLFAKYTADSGLYVDGSIRGGRVEADLYGGPGIGIKGENSYFGGHVGIGYEHKFTGTTSLDVYAKGIWTRQGGDSGVTDGGEHVRFGATNSVRSRVGARLVYTPQENVRLYGGLAWEHEFDGAAATVIDGTRVKHTNRLKGDSGIVSAGVEWAVTDRFTLGAEIQGSFGRRHGVGGMLTAKFKF